MQSDSFVEVHHVSFDSDTDAIQTILNGLFEPLTNDGNFGIECYQGLKIELMKYYQPNKFL